MKKLINTILMIVWAVSNILAQQLDPISHYFGYIPYFTASKLSYPVNNGSMIGWHDANPFGKIYKPYGTKHLGADINKNPYGNNDFGDTIYAIGNGKVILVVEWETNNINEPYVSIILILHKLHTKKFIPTYITSLYRHCQKSFVNAGDYVYRLQPISTIGTDNNTYMAHLHFEIRTAILIGIAGGYASNLTGFVDPIQFIKNFE